MKKTLTIILIIAVLAIGGYFVWKGLSHKEEKVIKIGVLTPLSGEGATYGEDTMRGVKLAVEEINKNGGILGRKIEIFPEDTQLDPAVGTRAIQHLIQIKKVHVIIGPFGSSVVLAVAKIANSQKIPIISASATADEIKYAGDYVFRIVPSNQLQGKTMADFVYNRLKISKKIVIYSMNNDYGESLKKGFKDEIYKLGGEIVWEDKFDPGQKDFRASLQKIKKISPLFVFLPDHYTEAGLILKQAKELGINTIWGGGDGSYSPMLIKLAGEGAEGFYLTMMGLGRGVPEEMLQRFTTAFKNSYGVSPSVYSAYAYDAVYVIKKAIEEVIEKGEKISGENIKEALYHVEYTGITGLNKFDKYGEVDKPFAIYKVIDGKFVEVKTFEGREK